MSTPACKRCKRTGLPALITDSPGRFNDHCADCEREIEREEEADWEWRAQVEYDEMIQDDYKEEGAR